MRAIRCIELLVQFTDTLLLEPTPTTLFLFFPRPAPLPASAATLAARTGATPSPSQATHRPAAAPEVCGLASLRGETVRIEQGGGGPPQTGDIHYNTMDKTGNE